MSNGVKKYILYAIIIIAVSIAGVFIVMKKTGDNQVNNLHQEMPSMGAPIPYYSLCETDSDCIHVNAVDDSGAPYVEPLRFQDCINKNYKERDLERSLYGRIEEVTGEKLCECRLVSGEKVCAFKTKKNNN
jgi:hypothetical protein